LSVRPSVHLSVCLWMRYDYHTGWNTSKIISQLINLGSSLSLDTKIMSLFQREHHEILAGIWVGYGKGGFRASSRRTKPAIALKRGNVGLQRKLLTVYMTSHTICRLVPKYMTLNDLLANCKMFCALRNLVAYLTVLQWHSLAETSLLFLVTHVLSVWCLPRCLLALGCQLISTKKDKRIYKLCRDRSGVSKSSCRPSLGVRITLYRYNKL